MMLQMHVDQINQNTPIQTLAFFIKNCGVFEINVLTMKQAQFLFNNQKKLYALYPAKENQRPFEVARDMLHAYLRILDQRQPNEIYRLKREYNNFKNPWKPLWTYVVPQCVRRFFTKIVKAKLAKSRKRREKQLQQEQKKSLMSNESTKLNSNKQKQR